MLIARPVALTVLLITSCPLLAADLEWLKVKRKKGQIDIKAELTLSAPTPEVYEALLEYDKFDELSDTFTDSRYIEPAEDGTPRVYTRIDGCIWFFCKTIERYARIETEPGVSVTAIAEPELSDAAMSVEKWTVTDNGDTTTIEYEHELKPGFWVPPLIGIMVIKGSIKRSAKEAGDRIEELALTSIAENTLQDTEAVAETETADGS